MSSRCRSAFALAFLASSAAASTWVVDDGGGPGVDFTSIAAAVVVAVPGDTIVVRPGNYAGFTLDEGISILGSSGAFVTDDVRIQNVPAGPRVALTALRIYRLEVRDCDAVVLLDGLLVSGVFDTGVQLDVAGCADVRLRRSQILHHVLYTSPSYVAARVADARLEITDSTLRGSTGYQADDGIPGEEGMSALLCLGGSDVHVSCSTLSGGRGGQGNADPFGPPGNGAAAIRVVSSTARLLVTGRASDFIVGGAPGDGPAAASGGPALVVSAGVARVSGVTLSTSFGAPLVVHTGGTLDQPSPADPSLSLPVATPPGQPVTFTLHGAPGAAARLRVGRQATVVDLPDVYEDRLTLPLRTYDLGTIPPSGSTTFVFNVPASRPDGFLAIFQASVVDDSGTRLTQSVPVVIH